MVLLRGLASVDAAFVHECKKRLFVLPIPIAGVGQTMACEPSPTNWFCKEKDGIQPHPFIYMCMFM